ncbi:MAG: DUF885 domain-containing protein [Candidatus Odinarchaeota archaeon]
MSDDERFVQWYKAVTDDVLKENPVFATFVGIHDYDHLLPDSSKEHTIKEHEKLMASWKEMKEKFDKTNLSIENQLDYDLLDHLCELGRFQFEVLETWKTGSRQGGGPVGGIGGSLFPLLTRDFAPFEKRAESMVERIERAPEYLERSKNHWIEPVKLWAELAIQECITTPGLLHFSSSLIAQHPAVSDELKERAVKAVENAVNAIGAYKNFLEEDVLPRANRDWCIGKENFAKLLEQRKLPYSADEILELGWNLYNETREELEKIANEIIPGKTFEEVRENIKRDHPETFEEILELYRSSVTEARKFVIEKELASVPGEGEIVEVIETPDYMRPVLPFAAYFLPAYCDPVKKGTYIVTRPQDPEMFQEHSRKSIMNTSVHEAYPGHHLQTATAAMNASFVRVLVQGTETIEGWAHYCEQMMLEEGFLQGKEIEFIQKLDVLWRAARIIIDVELSSGNMTFEEAVNFLIEKVGMKKEGARAEVNRYTSSPGYQLSYLIGKHLILQLRQKAKEKLGDKFNLQLFHDLILKSGAIPYHYLEKCMEQEMDKLLSG